MRMLVEDCFAGDSIVSGPPVCVRKHPNVQAMLQLATLLSFLAVCGCSPPSNWSEAANQALDLNPVALADNDLFPEPRTSPGGEFHPINPDRKNPFAYAGDYKSSEGPTFSGSLSSIIIQGFASADGQAAIISVDGRARTVKVGDTFSGVEVINIKPPSVTLRSGGIEWNASIFDKTIKEKG